MFHTTGVPTLNTPKELLEKIHRNLRRSRTRRHKAILERRVQRRTWYLAHLMRYKQEVDDPAPFRGVISYPSPLPVKEPRFCKLPLPVMVQQLLYQRGVDADGEYSRIMAATGLPPTIAEVIQLGRAASCKRREQVERRYLRRLKQRADEAYAAACADVDLRQRAEKIISEMRDIASEGKAVGDASAREAVMQRTIKDLTIGERP